MDKSVAPGDEFYDYANGSWMKTTEIPADRSSIGAFAVLAQQAQKDTREIVESAANDAKASGGEKKIGDYYAAFMDEAGIEAKGLAPVKPELDAISAISDASSLAKTLGGGLPAAAIGGTEEAMAPVEDGRVYQVGTYNGNPLAMAAARASLLEVLTPDAYELLDRLNERLLAGCTSVIERSGLPGYAVGVGAKGCVTFAPERIVDYETFKAHQDVEVTELAWVYNMNRGIFMTPGREEEWTLSVAHTEEDVDAYVAVFDELATELTA